MGKPRPWLCVEARIHLRHVMNFLDGHLFPKTSNP
jgi:hypothetical protein